MNGKTKNQPDKEQEENEIGNEQQFEIGKGENAQDADLEKKKKEQEIEQREEIWDFTQGLLVCTSALVFFIIILQGVGDWYLFNFHISPYVMGVLIGGFMVEVVGVLYIIAAKVFTDKS